MLETVDLSLSLLLLSSLLLRSRHDIHHEYSCVPAHPVLILAPQLQPHTQFTAADTFQSRLLSPGTSCLLCDALEFSRPFRNHSLVASVRLGHNISNKGISRHHQLTSCTSPASRCLYSLASVRVRSRSVPCNMVYLRNKRSQQV
jgi:hypothetical protein